jgi:hypothetical protein
MCAKETKETTMEPTVTTILPRLGSGLAVLLLHLLTTVALLALGALCYMASRSQNDFRTDAYRASHAS